MKKFIELSKLATKQLSSISPLYRCKHHRSKSISKFVKREVLMGIFKQINL